MPKGVMWTQRDYLLSTIVPLLTLGGPLPEAPDAVVEIARNGGFSVSFPIPPLMHGAALWVATMTLMGGNKLVLSSEHKLDPRAVWSTVEREKVLSVTLVGDAMARPLIEALDEPGADFDTSSLVILGSGGAILSPAVKAKINATLPNVVVIDSIGASETGYQGTFIQADDQGHPRFQMGEHTTVLDDDGNPVEPGSGVVGRLARGGFVPLGYYKDPEKTASVFVESADGRRWVLPGDMAMVEADGTIALLGRGSVSINSGGEKIFPEEVESALKSHPDVFDAVVVGVPDERWGERVAAVIKPRPGASPSLDELAAHVREQIAGYKVPKEVHLVDEVVRSPSGKPDYRWAKATATAAQR
jgi:acyl-CoA synthetase (AMP-forming)/AMP-acid ligase II